jgi:16S rRNA (uracil1498-N3)-methyltransferase
MNHILIFRSELLSKNTALISGERVTHLNNILKLKEGDSVKAGLIQGMKGVAEIQKINESEATLKFSFNETPKPKIPLTVIVGLCRPKVLSRIISDLTSMGVSGIDIIQTYFGDKGYWDNDLFSASGLETAVIKGLEQSMDTISPEINLVKRFGPYSNDVLPGMTIGNRSGFIALPGSACNLGSIEKDSENTVAIGPERGFTKYESEQFIKAGFKPVSLGERILRTETAVTVAAAGFIC